MKKILITLLVIAIRISLFGQGDFCNEAIFLQDGVQYNGQLNNTSFYQFNGCGSTWSNYDVVHAIASLFVRNVIHDAELCSYSDLSESQTSDIVDLFNDFELNFSFRKRLQSADSVLHKVEDFHTDRAQSENPLARLRPLPQRKRDLG